MPIMWAIVLLDEHPEYFNHAKFYGRPEFLSFLAGFSKTMLVDSWSSFSNQSEVIVWFLMSLVKTSLGPRLSSQINEARDVGVTCKMIL